MTSAVPTVQSEALGRLNGVRHAFFTRQGGVSSGLLASLNGGLGAEDDPANVHENRARMASALGLTPGTLALPWQVHSADVAVATAPWSREEAPRVDAVVTATPGLAAAVTVADCGPILFADAEAGVVAAAHAGWQGAFKGVAEATLATMETLGARRERVTAVLGPCIRQASYEVGPEFTARFVAADEDNARFFEPSGKPGHALFDLAAYIVARLRAAGVGTVDDVGLDTYADEQRFFSYRRATHRGEADYGRLVAAIALA
ncbi:peptidoglycan editing factor PgeF [Methylopila turkensis]|uniref:Purine nucleoside phosphorylase n=1 Tax=Methylopila turkensis TaxID=1437816 RepID=A0A9W6JPI5_9HYPH|nr:peptidoglycan editing factor PgeF [Methylopila turkensis]GLK79238.1 laccase domain protein [Methylopila turkensis]